MAINKFFTTILISLSIVMAASLRVRQTNLSLSSPPTNTSGAASTPSDSELADTVAKLTVARTQMERLNILKNDTDFVFDVLNPTSGTVEIAGNGGHIVSASRENFPAIVGTGLSMNVAFVEPCGLNTPHLHPRANELFFAINGTFEIGFVAETGTRVVTNTVKGGQIAVFPQGSLHYQANLGCEKAVFIAAFSNEDAGVSLVAQNFFRIPHKILEATLGDGVSLDQLKYISDILPEDLVLGLKSCRQKCGLDQDN